MVRLPEPDLSIFDDPTNDEERCGVIVERPDGKLAVVELPNRAANQRDHFVIRNEDIHVALFPSDTIVAVVHTHPSRFSYRPSIDDMRAVMPGLVGMVYHPSSKRTTWYDNSGIIKTKKRR